MRQGPRICACTVSGFRPGEFSTKCAKGRKSAPASFPAPSGRIFGQVRQGAAYLRPPPLPTTPSRPPSRTMTSAPISSIWGAPPPGGVNDFGADKPRRSEIMANRGFGGEPPPKNGPLLFHLAGPNNGDYSPSTASGNFVTLYFIHNLTMNNIGGCPTGFLR
jgi:hypothetical protein